ncbi:MAG: DUF58 domain-containing protein [Myxococcales bacterium]|nr:DUF58 domain-containing protein [Myxococcales bacterium]USN51200.1 MAG: DUF58 domain-containing protein [Myxococcales bacterium]
MPALFRQQSSSNVVSNGIFCTLAELFHEGQKSLNKTLHLKRKAKAQSGGLKRSSIRGRGMEFFESRPYVPQDEIRNIDWKVSARLNNLYTKIFVEEKNRPVYLAIDMRPHMFFGTKNCFKSVLSARIAARLAFAALNGADQIGGAIFDGHRVIDCPLSMRRNYVSRFLGQIAKSTEKSGEEVAPNFWHGVFQHLCNRVHRGSQLFLMSDFLDFDSSMRAWLIRILKKNDVIALKIIDPLELELPSIGQLGMSYGEHQLIFNSNDKNIQEHYKDWFKSHSAMQKEFFRKLEIPFLEFKTSDNLDEELNKLFLGKW